MSDNLWLHRFVKVISGPHVAKRGRVEQIDGDTLTIRSTNKLDEFTVLKSEVKFID